MLRAAGKAQLAPYGKRMVALSMYEKGKNFVGAAVLLRRMQGNQYVVLHLLCHGIEGILKGLLLLHDYDTFQPQLTTSIRHDLRKAAQLCSGEFGLKPPDANAVLAGQLKDLNELYRKHRLRYGTGLDILIDPTTIPYDRVLRRIAAVLRLAERHLGAATRRGGQF
jgi:hypothetical protein